MFHDMKLGCEGIQGFTHEVVIQSFCTKVGYLGDECGRFSYRKAVSHTHRQVHHGGAHLGNVNNAQTIWIPHFTM